jgi:hypothetical protein
MAEGRATPRSGAAAEPADSVDESERALGRAVAKGLPVATVVGAIAVGVAFGVGAALLVLAAGALLGTIAFLWASLRTLSGDAALPVEIEALAARGRDTSDLGERVIRAKRAIKDLENEHALGRIDDEDYRELLARYRNEAKDLYRAQDREEAPKRAEAERLVREYLAKKKVPSAAGVASEGSPRASRLECESCHGANEPDATFCKHCGAKMKREVTARDSTS